MNMYCPKCREQRSTGIGTVLIDGKKPTLPDPGIICSKCGEELLEGIILTLDSAEITSVFNKEVL